MCSSKFGKLLISVLVSVGYSIGGWVSLSGGQETKIEKRALIDKISEQILPWNEIFRGLGVETKSSYPLKNRKVEIVTRFDQKSADRWRIDLQGVATTLVVARNKQFVFDAVQDNGEFQFAKLGFEQDIIQDLERKLRTQFPLIGRTTHVAGLDILSLLSLKTTTIDEFSTIQPDDLGCTVERIRFRSALIDGRQVQGELEWLPDHGYLLKRGLVSLDAKSNTQGTEIQTIKAADNPKKLLDVATEFRFFDGRLLPVRIVDQSNSSDAAIITELLQVRQSNPNLDYYSPESIGLATPPSPVKPWKQWAVLAGVCFVLALVFMRWNHST